MVVSPSAMDWIKNLSFGCGRLVYFMEIGTMARWHSH